MKITELKVRVYGDPCLRKKCKPIKKVGPAERMIISSMIQAMYDHKGIGLAAPQIGINEQLFVADIGDGPFAVINPRIFKQRGANIMEEGCLCLPGISVKVRRSKKIVVQYIDEQNQKVEKECDDLLAKVFQHETDHLKGKMIIDHASLREKIKYRKQLAQLRKLSRTNKDT
ncbi:MAG: peptide deformylase [Candidatus Omnitrophota bacterium]